MSLRNVKHHRQNFVVYTKKHGKTKPERVFIETPSDFYAKRMFTNVINFTELAGTACAAVLSISGVEDLIHHFDAPNGSPHNLIGKEQEILGIDESEWNTLYS
ncbi:hypothetical protein [Azonexus hydrophilus]|uniref:Uncharacterized protein n=1 Tax=Azonexus hydrophilus TaxID=418702 RepID=A0ABZ2XM69_9RHOO